MRKNNLFKKAACGMLVLTFLAALTGCGSEPTVDSQTSSPEQESAQSAPQVPVSVKKTDVEFHNTATGTSLAGIIFEPENLDQSVKTPAILVGGPLASVKEQTQSIYAERLAQLGYVTMVFDYTYYGESDGEPRRLENPTMKDSDIKSAVSYLSNLPYVDGDKIGAVGICGSGGQFAYTAASDNRIKALATVVPYGIGMNTMAEALTEEQRNELIAQRDAYENGTADAVYAGVYNAPYYTDPARGNIPEFDNIGTVTWSTLYFAEYDLESTLPQLTTPLLIISPETKLSDTAEKMNELAAGYKEYYLVEGSNHFDHYDQEPYVSDNIERMQAFFQTQLVERDSSAKIADQTAFDAANEFGTGVPNSMFEQYFIGNSYLNPLTAFGETSVFLANVTFEPGCRNNWHIHHADEGGGQILICTAGEGWYQEEGKNPVSLIPGMVITIPAGVKHWHGAKEDSWFAHISVEVPGVNTSNEWLEPVTDEVYNAL